MDIKCLAAIEKFRDYVLKPGFDQGKFQIFHTLGYTQEHAEQLIDIYTRQAAERYGRGDFRRGRKTSTGNVLLSRLS